MSLRKDNNRINWLYTDLINSQKNLLDLTKEYFIKKLKLAEDGNKSAPKILVLDDNTYQIISVLFMRKELNDFQIFVFENIKNSKNIKKIDYVKTICIIEPTDDNIKKLKNELQNTPRSNEYYIYFTDFLDDETNSKITTLLCPTVKIMSEIYLNTLISHMYCFHLPNQANKHEKDISKYLFNMCVSLNIHADIITSKTTKCETIGNLLHNSFNKYDGKNLKSKNLVLIMDRKNDLVFPLITTWTYLSMIHEYFGICDKTISLGEDKILIDFMNDKFLKQNCYCNYGEIGESIKSWTEEFKNKNDEIKKLKEQKDVKKLAYISLDHIDFNKCFDRHLKITDFIFKKVRSNNLLKISEYEQELFCNENLDYSEIYNNVTDIIKNPSVDKKYKIKLSLLFLLRYDFDKTIVQQIRTLFEPNTAIFDKILESFTKAFDKNINQIKIPANKNIILNFLSRAFTNTKVENMYLRYKPLIKIILDCFQQRTKLDTQQFLYLTNSYNCYNNIIIYVNGGITYDELFYVSQFNNKKLGINVYLGGDTMLNTGSYIEELHNIASKS